MRHVFFQKFAGSDVRQRAPMLWSGLLPLLIAAFGILWGGRLCAQPAVRDTEVKATLLFNFCHFVQWPDTAFGDPAAPFVIAILGRDPFGKFLDELVADEKAHGRRIQVLRVSRVEDIAHAHMVYVGASEQTRVRRVVGALRGRPILSVGEEVGDGFTRAGGLVGFATVKGNVRIWINLDEARAAGLSISAKLLRLAVMTTTQNPP
jgi:hypothetical protein